MAGVRTLILRFVDLDDPTIDLHQAVLNRHGEVWWGWWKKLHEEPRLDVIEAVAAHVPVTIGLVNRRSQRFYRAVCDRVQVATDSAAIRSPEPGLTPDYYNDREFPAWFHFQEIKEIGLEEWNELFDGFGEPTGDDTLYPIDDAPSPHEPSSEIPVYEFGTPGEAILHLSDVHYGDDHGFGLESGKLEGRSMRRIVVEALREMGIRVGVLVISGDITTGGDLHVMQAVALTEIRALAGDLELPVENVVIVPGNHDIKLLEAEFGSYKHELGFRTFLDELFGDGVRELDAVCSFETPGGLTLNFATLNSVRLSSRDTRMFGYVGPRSKFVFETLSERNAGRNSEELAAAGIFNFAVLHHHLISGALMTDPPPSAPVSLTLDAGRIIAEAQAAGVHVALHGHEHLPFIGSAARQEPLEQDGWDGYRRPLMVVGGGSAGARFQRLPTRMRDNTFGLYVPDDRALDVAVFRFNHEVAPHELLRTRHSFEAG
jgi:hypothetical protein